MRFIFLGAAVVLLAAVFLMIGCSKASGSESAYTEDCSGAAKSFASDVNPIIQTYCTKNSGCHAAGSRDGVLTSYQEIYYQRNTIYSEVKSGHMPNDGSLTTAQRNAILCWISSGATNN